MIRHLPKVKCCRATSKCMIRSTRDVPQEAGSRNPKLATKQKRTYIIRDHKNSKSILTDATKEK